MGDLEGGGDVSTCAWLEEFGMCLIKTLADGVEYVYCECLEAGSFDDCPNYKEFKEDVKHV